MKLPKKNSKTINAPWRIDFRNVEALPDIKVIRTSFFINAIAFILPAIVIILWVQKEIVLSGLNDDVASLTSERDSKIGGDGTLVEHSRKFAAEAAKITALEGYDFNLFEGSEFIIALSESSSDKIVLNSIRITKSGRVEGGNVVDVWESTTSGYVVEAGAEATAMVNTFVETIKQKELWVNYLEDVFVENLSRDSTSGSLSFTLHMTFVKTKKEAK